MGRIFQLTHGINCTQKQFDYYRKIYEEKAGLPPTMVEKASTFISSVKDFISDGCKLVSEEEYKDRLKICDGCEERKGNSCNICGCNLQLKAKGKTFKCPLQKWKNLE